MNYGQSQDYLKSLQRFGIKLGLENIRTLLESRGDPHLEYPSLIVAGTNGKGSVAAMLARILSGHGFRTGLYTSPHLVRIEERIRIGERLITPGELRRGLTAIRNDVEGLLASGRLTDSPTYFEVITALALTYFRDSRVDFAVLEVGIGGRFDATNAVTPLVSVITTISKDHQKYLGQSLGEIAFEKAGIIKEGVPVICGVRRGTAFGVIRRRARELKAPFVEVFGPATSFKPQSVGRGFRFRYDSGAATYSYAPSLQGVHQGENAAVAIRVAEVLGTVWKPLKKRSIVEGIGRTHWEGRLELVSRKPPVILDGAHNPEGAASLGAYISDVLREPVVLVFGAMKDKDIRRIADILFPLARKVILTQVRMPRAASPEDMLSLCRKHAGKIMLEPDVGKAFQQALAEAGVRTPIIVAGSLFLVGEVKKLLKSKRV
jgi:dihydrofolate synthase/folylpolyglutamate synthase